MDEIIFTWNQFYFNIAIISGTKVTLGIIILPIAQGLNELLKSLRALVYGGAHLCDMYGPIACSH